MLAMILINIKTLTIPILLKMYSCKNGLPIHNKQSSDITKAATAEKDTIENDLKVKS